MGTTWCPHHREDGAEAKPQALGHPEALRISNSWARSSASLASRKIPWSLSLSWGAGWHSCIKPGSPVGCRTSFSMTAWTGGFLPRLKCLSWEQWLRADKMASTRESLIPHRPKCSQSWRVVATFSSRTWRTSGLKLVMVTPLRTRPFSWLMFGLWDWWVESDSVSQQLVIDRLFKGDGRHLGRNQIISSWKLEC